MLQAPSGTVADYFLLRTAEKRGAQVVSNDEFEQYRREFPWIKRRRVPYMIVSESVQLYLPKLDLPAEAAQTPVSSSVPSRRAVIRTAAAAPQSEIPDQAAAI